MREWLKHDLTKRCSVGIDLDMLGSSENPLFFGDFLIWDDVEGIDQTGNQVKFGGGVMD